MKMIRNWLSREEPLGKPLPGESISSMVNASESPAITFASVMAVDADGAFAQEMMQMLATVGTGLWRMKQKLVQPDTNEPLDEMRRVYRHFESVWDAIVQAGAEIQDHTNELYDSGMTLRVIAFQPTVGIAREIISETLKPTIYFRNQLIQKGEVIVATPDE